MILETSPCKSRLRFVHVAHAMAAPWPFIDFTASSPPRLCARLRIAVSQVSRAPASEPNSTVQAGCLHSKALWVCSESWGWRLKRTNWRSMADRVAQFVTERSRSGQVALPPIDDVLAAWITLFGGQVSHVSLKRLPFIPDDDIRPVMDALAALTPSHSTRPSYGRTGSAPRCR